MKLSPEWLNTPQLDFLLGELSDGGHKAYVVGGCVRDALFGLPCDDIDVATSRTPEQVKEALEGFKATKLYPTGLDHGTWTVEVDGLYYEVTTFREDQVTDGRHAQVAYAKTMEEDAMRRDFTMNALYMDYTGEVYDPTGEGVADALARRVRFVGDAEARCREDYLRILRLFRFHAKYGKGPMDADAFWAAKACSEGLTKVSGERIWVELKKLLLTHDPCDALLDMERAGVLARVLPKNCGPGGVAEVMAVERLASMAPGWERRYVALMGRDRADIPFPHSKEERKAVQDLVNHWRLGYVPAHAAFVTGDRARAYDCAVLSRSMGYWGWDESVHDSVNRGMEAKLPVVAQDFMDRGVEPGPKLGECMRRATKLFVTKDLLPNREQLVRQVMALV